MPRARKTDKFFLYAAKKSGYWKDKRLLGINYLYTGSVDDLTLQDLLDFLTEKSVSPSAVRLSHTFSTFAKK
jgi:hypothetical protein